MSKPTLAIYGIKDRNTTQYPTYVHDHNLCLMQDGKILQYLQLERYSRRKYDNRLDVFIEELIENKLLDLPREFDLVSVNSFVGNAFISQSGKIRFEADKALKLSESLEPARAYYQYNTWQGNELTAYNCSQELAHITSCMPFFGDLKNNSLLIHFDGGASLSNFSVFLYKEEKIQLIEYHWNLKHLANLFNDNALSFKIIGANIGEHTSVPGKLMGYACLGKYNPDIEKWLQKHHFFKEYWHKDEEIIESIYLYFGKRITHFDTKEPFLQDIAATFQHIFEREVISKIKQLQQQTKTKYLYYSGGCALNIITNTKILKERIFEEIYIPPCCNDSGLSIGAASLLERIKGNTIALHLPFLNNVGVKTSDDPIHNDLIKEVAEILLKKGVIGICNGYGEIGPRALGNRSLIALANDKELAQKISQEVKKREWYRPIAPIMLQSVAEEVTDDMQHSLNQFMLLDCYINSPYKKDLEGVIHTNGTARIQTLKSKYENPFMFELLTYLKENYQIKALINTSFNRQGEPIVHTAESAMKSAKEMGLNGVVINHKLYKL